MRALINSLKRLYAAGRLTKEQIAARVEKGTIDEAEYEEITGEKYKAEKKDFEERKAFAYELNHSQSVYHRDYEDKHRERGKKRFLGSEFRGERG